MNTIYKITALFCALILSSACIEDFAPETEEMKTVTFTFSPSFLGLDSEPGTKAMRNNPDIRNIYYAVFDGTGYKLSEYAEAVPNTLATENGVNYQYSVELTITNEKRIVHFIANAPKRLVYGSESESIGSLTTMLEASDTDGEWRDAYWARVEFEHGFWEAPDEEKHGAKGSDSYELQKSRYDEARDLLNGVKLVRNFAKINVEQDVNVTNFTMRGFWLTNYPDRGSVAPYNRNTRRFQSNYSNFTREEDITDSTDPEANYQGYTPASAQIVSIAGLSNIDSRMVSVSGSPLKGVAFCYEREVPRTNPMYIIIKGRFNGDAADTYYKLDLRDDEGHYFPILRNFSYSIHIDGVSSSGSATIEDALIGPPRNGDVSTSLEMQELTNMSNGRSQMFVSETSQVIVGSSPILLRYKYIPDLEGNPTVSANGTTQQDAGYVTITRTNGDTGAVFETITVAGSNSDDGYREITLTPYAPNEIIKNETITITGKYKSGTDAQGNPIWDSITRTVEYKLREKLTYTVECIPSTIPQSIGQEVVVRIGLEDGLPSSVFSLDFNLEAEGLSLTSDPNYPLPVHTGSSTIEGSSRPAYHYTETLTWSEYQSLPVENGVKYLYCHFITNKAFSGGQGDRIYVNNHYFTQNSAAFTTYAEKSFTTAAFTSVPRVGNKSVFNFTMPSIPVDSKVRVGLQGFEPWPDAAGALPMTHIGMNADGLDEYEVTVSTTSGTLNLNPYSSGLGIVKLYAQQYVPERVETTVLEPDGIFVWADVTNSNATAFDWIRLTGYDVTREGQPVIGQPTTLTVYVGGNHTANDVKINGTTATRVTSGTGSQINVQGETCNAYYINYTPTTREIKRIHVTVADVECATFELPVWGITRGTRLTTTTTDNHKAYETGQFYILVDYTYRNPEYHLYSNSDTSIAGRLSSNNQYDYYSLFGFGSAGSTSTVFVPSRNRFVRGRYGEDFTLNTSGRTYTIVPNSNGYQFSITRNSVTQYWYQSSSTDNLSMNANARYFRVYPATLVKP